MSKKLFIAVFFLVNPLFLGIIGAVLDTYLHVKPEYIIIVGTPIMGIGLAIISFELLKRG